MDKIEYSRLLIKRSTTAGETPTIPPITATTLNQFTPTDVFEGEFFLNSADDLLWVRTENGILPISLSGSTGSTPSLTQVLFQGNVTNGYDIEVSSGDTIVFQGLNTGSTSTILGLDASGNTITTNLSTSTPSLDQVLAVGNQTGTLNIVVSSGSTIQYKLLNTGSTNTILGLDASGNTITTTVSDFNTYITGGTISYTGSTGVLDLFDNSGSTITITGLTDVFLTGGTYSSSDGELTLNLNDGNNIVIPGFFTGYTSLVETITAGTGLSANTSTGNVTLINTAPDQVVSITGGSNISSTGTYPNFTIAATGLTDYYVTGGTFSTSGGTLTLDRQNGSVSITGFTANRGCLGITIDGAGAPITTGLQGYLYVPYNCIVDAWAIIADQSGSIVVDVWRGASPLVIPTGATQSIAGTEKPNLSSQQSHVDTNLTTWTKDLLYGDIIAFNVDSASTVTRVTLQLKVIKV